MRAVDEADALPVREERVVRQASARLERRLGRRRLRRRHERGRRRPARLLEVDVRVPGELRANAAAAVAGVLSFQVLRLGLHGSE